MLERKRLRRWGRRRKRGARGWKRKKKTARKEGRLSGECETRRWRKKRGQRKRRRKKAGKGGRREERRRTNTYWYVTTLKQIGIYKITKVSRGGFFFVQVALWFLTFFFFLVQLSQKHTYDQKQKLPETVEGRGQRYQWDHPSRRGAQRLGSPFWKVVF